MPSLEKRDETFKTALEKVIDFILKSQYPEGGWPQRFPLRYDFIKNGNQDYTSLFTFNDDVIWENIHFLVQCYQNLSKDDYTDAIVSYKDAGGDITAVDGTPIIITNVMETSEDIT